MKQQAPKTLPQKAETIENTRKTADILIGATRHKATVFQLKYGGFSNFLTVSEEMQKSV